MESAQADVRTAPYLSWGRFEGWIESLKGKPVPPRIDRSVTARMSGADRSQLKIANVFLGLVEGDDASTTESLRRLVAARGTGEWQTALASVVVPAYQPIVAGLEEHATRGQLEQRFRDRGNVSGASLAKAIRFYLAAANAAQLSVSPHFDGPGASPKSANGTASKTPRVRSAKNRQRGIEQSVVQPTAPTASPPTGMRELQFPLPSKNVQLWIPDDITDAELDFVWRYLRDYLNLKNQRPLESKPVGTD